MHREIFFVIRRLKNLETLHAGETKWVQYFVGQKDIMQPDYLLIVPGEQKKKSTCFCLKLKSIMVLR